MTSTNQPDPRRDLAFLKAEYDRLLQSQLDQQRLDWELQRMEIDLQLLQDEQFRQQQDLDRQLQDDLEADRRDLLNQQRAELEQRRADLQEFREEVQQSREAIQQSESREAPALVQSELVEEGDRQVATQFERDESLTQWEQYCLSQLEKPDGQHTRMWEGAVEKATGEDPASHQQWHEYRESLQAIAQQPDQQRDEGMER